MNRGLTLIELLVVTAIILILVAVLLPAYSRAKASANTVAMLEQQRQITLALKIYSDDSDGTFIGYQGFPDKRWPQKLEAYCKSDTVLNNPQFEGHGGDMGNGFAINSCHMFTNFVETENPIQLFEAVPYIDSKGARYHMFEDRVMDIHVARLYPGASPIGGKWLASARNSGSIVSFYDGSAKWVNASSIPYRGNPCYVKANEKEFFETKIGEN